jgi:hypothetical protein
MSTSSGRVDAAAWLAKVQGVAKPDQPVIVICRSGNRTRAASQLLSQQAGYAKVYNVKDGIRAWATRRPSAGTGGERRRTLPGRSELLSVLYRPGRVRRH